MQRVRLARLEEERGHALVELALVLPVLLTLVFGIITFGWVFLNYNQVVHAAREGARYGAIQPTEAQNIANRIEVAASPNFSVELVDDEAGFEAGGPEAGVIRVYIDFPDHPQNEAYPGNRIRVRLKATIPFLVPMVVADTSEITVTTAGYMRIE